MGTSITPTMRRAAVCAVQGQEGMIGYEYDAEGNVLTVDSGGTEL